MDQTFDKYSIERIYGEPFVPGNRVTLLYRGKDSFDAILSSIEEARNLICLHFYIFRNDETGAEVAELLKRKAREGVRVYILYDHFGSFGTPRKFWNDLKKEGIQIRASRPFKWTSPYYYIHRDHRKLIVTDLVKAFTGGLNIANEYRGLYLPHKRKREEWRDTGIMLEGPIAFELFDRFRKSWITWGGEPISLKGIPHRRYRRFKANGLPVIPIFASSSRGRRRMRKLLYYSINHAKESIYLTTAYFVPSKRMIETLEEAVKRGVEVNLLLPGKSDVKAPYYAGRAFFQRLLQRGIKIYNFQEQILHAKTYVFDKCWSIVGSANLDFQSLRWNDEGNVGILDNEFGKKMLDIFYEDLQKSIEIKEEDWINRPIAEKIKERFFSLFRRRL